MLTKLLLSCLLTPVPADLQSTYLEACAAWWPYRAQVTRVEWCEYESCDVTKVGGGGGFNFQSRVITIDRGFNWTGNKLLLTLEHEYGHALGLPHSPMNDSIMREGWEEPLAQGPTERDFIMLRLL